MMMEFDQDQALGPKEQYSQFIKGKRTKRQRPASPLTLGVTASSSSSAGESGGDQRERIIINNNELSSSTSPSTSVEFTESSVEEEDMANCLILLAQGNYQNCHFSHQPAIVSSTNRNNTDNYKCKTCNRCFPSFQALGGHRASHKKPKVVYEEKKALTTTTTERILQQEEEDRIDIASTTLSLQIPNNRVLCNPPPPQNVKSNKVHECSICGAEYSSGQALGGHMRRHRLFANTSITPTTSSPDHRQSHQELKKPRNNLQLDLNLPAPEDHDLRESKFHFVSTKDQVLVFTSTSPWVDCHY